MMTKQLPSSLPLVSYWLVFYPAQSPSPKALPLPNSHPSQKRMFSSFLSFLLKKKPLSFFYW